MYTTGSVCPVTANDVCADINHHLRLLLHVHIYAQMNEASTLLEALAMKLEAHAAAGHIIDEESCECGVISFILDSRRVLAPAPKVLGPKHISNPDFPPF